MVAEEGTRVVLRGSKEEIAKYKHSDEYRTLLQKGVKIKDDANPYAIPGAVPGAVPEAKDFRSILIGLLTDEELLIAKPLLE